MFLFEINELEEIITLDISIFELFVLLLWSFEINDKNITYSESAKEEFRLIYRSLEVEKQFVVIIY